MAERIAFLIGNRTFPLDSELPPLHGPANDVTALARLLRDPRRGGFDVREFVDKRSDEILPEIEQALGNAAPGDFFLIYFSGHGRLDRSGRLCLATANTRKIALRTTSIPARDLSDLIGASKCNQALLLLDCCYSGAVEKDFFRGDVDSQMQVIAEARGIYIMTASTSTQAARETELMPGGAVMGRFTAALVEGIQSGAADTERKGKILLSDLRRYLGRVVTGQTPQFIDRNASGDPLISLTLGRAHRRRLPLLPDRITRGQLDELPLNSKLAIKKISYGDGIQNIVGVQQLYVLPTETKFLDRNGDPTNLVELAMTSTRGVC